MRRTQRFNVIMVLLLIVALFLIIILPQSVFLFIGNALETDNIARIDFDPRQHIPDSVPVIDEYVFYIVTDKLRYSVGDILFFKAPLLNDPIQKMFSGPVSDLTFVIKDAMTDHINMTGDCMYRDGIAYGQLLIGDRSGLFTIEIKHLNYKSAIQSFRVDLEYFVSVVERSTRVSLKKSKIVFSFPSIVIVPNFSTYVFFESTSLEDVDYGQPIQNYRGDIYRTEHPRSIALFEPIYNGFGKFSMVIQPGPSKYVYKLRGSLDSTPLIYRLGLAMLVPKSFVFSNPEEVEFDIVFAESVPDKENFVLQVHRKNRLVVEGIVTKEGFKKSVKFLRWAVDPHGKVKISAFYKKEWVSSVFVYIKPKEKVNMKFERESKGIRIDIIDAKRDPIKGAVVGIKIATTLHQTPSLSESIALEKNVHRDEYTKVDPDHVIEYHMYHTIDSSATLPQNIKRSETIFWNPIFVSDSDGIVTIPFINDRNYKLRVCIDVIVDGIVYEFIRDV
jgi:hypothetical protein